MLRRAHQLTVRLVLLALCSSCVPRPLALPAGPGTPRPDFASVFDQATAACRDTRTLSAELVLSGRAVRQKLRARVLAGLGPAALRLEGVAPFGPPAFVFVANQGVGTLMLPRDRRVLKSAPPADILQALAGVALAPDDLRLLLAGCVKASAVPTTGRAYGSEWIAIDLAGGGTAYLRRQDNDWRVVAGMHSGLIVEYRGFLNGRPRAVRVRSARNEGSPQADVDLSVTLGQVEINGTIDPRAFRLDVPSDALPLTLEELREAGPLGST